MGRKNEGTVKLIDGRWCGKWTRPDDGKRTPWYPLPGPPIPPDEAYRPAAKARAAEVARDGQAYQARASGSETCAKYFDRLLVARVADGIRDTRKERGVWRKWLAPTLADRPVVDVTRDEIEAIRNRLDDEVRLRIRDGLKAGISGATAQNVWSMLRIMFKETVNARDPSMRPRTDDPTAGHKPPLTTPARQKTFVHPNEFAKLVACPRVPLAWRQVYAVGAYTYVRPEELEALTWRDVDLEAATVSINKATDARTGKPKALPKTDAAVRDVPVDPALLPLLRDLHEHRDSDDAAILPVLGTLNDKFRAKQFRAHLKLADCTRSRLTADTATLLPVNFRSLRDSGITWLALAGLGADRIQRRAGHEDHDTTLRYVKMAEDLGGKVGTPFAPLPASLLQSYSIVPNTIRSSKNAGNVVPEEGIEGAPEAANSAAVSATSEPSASDESYREHADPSVGRQDVAGRGTDDDEAILLDKIADAEIAGRTESVEALTRKLNRLRAAKADGKVRFLPRR